MKSFWSVSGQPLQLCFEGFEGIWRGCKRISQILYIAFQTSQIFTFHLLPLAEIVWRTWYSPLTHNALTELRLSSQERHPETSLCSCHTLHSVPLFLGGCEHWVCITHATSAHEHIRSLQLSTVMVEVQYEFAAQYWGLCKRVCLPKRFKAAQCVVT